MKTLRKLFSSRKAHLFRTFLELSVFLLLPGTLSFNQSGRRDEAGQWPGLATWLTLVNHEVLSTVFFIAVLLFVFPTAAAARSHGPTVEGCALKHREAAKRSR